MKRLCSCGRLVEKGERCPCRAAKPRKDNRPSAARRGYDEDWRKLRARVLAAHPACAFCGRPAKHVDHIKSIVTHPHLRLVAANLRPLCHSCHSRHTARTRPWGDRG